MVLPSGCGQPLEELVALLCTQVSICASSQLDGAAAWTMTSFDTAGPMPSSEVVCLQYFEAPIFWSKSRMVAPASSPAHVTVTMRAEASVAPPWSVIWG